MEMKCSERGLGIVILFLALFALAGCSLAAKDPLEGTNWLLTDLAGTKPVEGTTLTAEFSDGQIGGSAGCNSYGGSYEVKGDKLEVGDLMSTMMACMDEGVMEQEQAYLGYLQNAASFEITDTGLKILTENGAELTFAPAVE